MEDGRPRHGPWHPRSWGTLALRTAKDSKEDRILGLGAEVAFFSLLSLPPALLAIFGAVGYLAEAIGPRAAGRIRDQILGVIDPFLTAESLDRVRTMIDTFLMDGRAGVISVGLVLSLWSASRATNVVMEAVNVAYDQPERRSGIRRRGVALAITLAGILGAVAVIPLVVAGPRFGEFVGRPLGLGDMFAAIWRVLYWPGVGLLGIGMLATVYHLALAAVTPWRRDLPGAFLAAGLWLAGGAGLRLYLAVAVDRSAAYGPLAAPIALLLWLYVSALALLVGAELNAEIEKLWPAAVKRTEDAGETTSPTSEVPAPVNPPAADREEVIR